MPRKKINTAERSQNDRIKNVCHLRVTDQWPELNILLIH
nr:hypothetical protein 220p1_00045 [Serratia entomophila]